MGGGEEQRAGHHEGLWLLRSLRLLRSRLVIFLFGEIGTIRWGVGEGEGRVLFANAARARGLSCASAVCGRVTSRDISFSSLL